MARDLERDERVEDHWEKVTHIVLFSIDVDIIFLITRSFDRMSLEVGFASMQRAPSRVGDGTWCRRIGYAPH